MTDSILWTTVPSPIGELTLHSDGDRLTRVWMGAYRPAREERARLQRDPAHFKRAAAELKAYFAGDLRKFTVPYRTAGSDFQERVWRELFRIPFGVTVSYGEIARRLEQPSASRAVGLATGSNPIAIIIPCHRVLGSDGSLTGFGGGLKRKRWLLEHEGAESGASLFAGTARKG